jgi:hypothetical protein
MRGSTLRLRGPETPNAKPSVLRRGFLRMQGRTALGQESLGRNLGKPPLFWFCRTITVRRVTALSSSPTRSPGGSAEGREAMEEREGRGAHEPPRPDVSLTSGISRRYRPRTRRDSRVISGPHSIVQQGCGARRADCRRGLRDRCRRSWASSRASTWSLNGQSRNGRLETAARGCSQPACS